MRSVGLEGKSTHTKNGDGRSDVALSTLSEWLVGSYSVGRRAPKLVIRWNMTGTPYDVQLFRDYAVVLTFITGT